jgi:enolase-phosphatase E1
MTQTTVPVQAILLDIEGTTTSIRFVYETLFPYATREMSTFLHAHWEDANVQSDVAEVRAQAQRDLDDGIKDAPQIPAADCPPDVVRAAVLDNLHWQMDQDRKTTGLKSLQGRIWVHGYATGELLGHVYEDVVPALKAWQDQGIPVYIYSSGSVAAQKLLFGHSAQGDLMPLLAGYFDTTTGPKKEAGSYGIIADAVGCEPKALCFVTDSHAEAIAAHAAGVQVALSVRPGNAALPPHDFLEVQALTALL